MSVLSAHIISELKALEGRARLTYPTASIDHPTVERVFKVLLEEKDRTFAETDEEYPSARLTEQRVVDSSNTHAYIYCKWETVPGLPLSTLAYYGSSASGQPVFEKTTVQRVPAATEPDPATAGLGSQDQVQQENAVVATRTTSSLVDAEGNLVTSDAGRDTIEEDPATKTLITTRRRIVAPGESLPRIGALYPPGSSNTYVIAARRLPIKGSPNSIAEIEFCEVPPPRVEFPKVAYRFPAIFTFLSTQYSYINGVRFQPPYAGVHYNLVPHRQLRRPARSVTTYSLGPSGYSPEVFRVQSYSSRVFPLPDDCIHPGWTWNEYVDVDNDNDLDSVKVEVVPPSSPSRYSSFNVLTVSCEERIWRGNIYERTILQVSEALSPHDFPTVYADQPFRVVSTNPFASQPGLPGERLVLRVPLPGPASLSLVGKDATGATIREDISSWSAPLNNGPIAVNLPTVQNPSGLVYGGGTNFIGVTPTVGQYGSIACMDEGDYASYVYTLDISNTAARGIPAGTVVNDSFTLVWDTGTTITLNIVLEGNSVFGPPVVDGRTQAVFRTSSAFTELLDVQLSGPIIPDQLRIQQDGQPKAALLRFSYRPLGGDTLKVGVAGSEITYTFTSSSPNPTSYQVATSSSMQTCAKNLVAAINRSAGAGTAYSSAMVAHPDVEAEWGGVAAPDTVVLRQRNLRFANTVAMTLNLPATIYALQNWSGSQDGPLVATLSLAKPSAYADALYNGFQQGDGVLWAQALVPAGKEVTSEPVEIPGRRCSLELSSDAKTPLLVFYQVWEDGAWVNGDTALPSLSENKVYNVELAETFINRIRIRVNNSGASSSNLSAFVYYSVT